MGYIVYQRAHSRAINRQIGRECSSRSTVSTREEAQARAILNKPANREIADQVGLPERIVCAQGAVLDAHLYRDGEDRAAQLHVVSMKPDYTKTNDLVLHMVVATDSRDRAVELVRRMEKSNHFRQSQVVAETVVANTSDQSAARVTSSSTLPRSTCPLRRTTTRRRIADEKATEKVANRGKTSSPAKAAVPAKPMTMPAKNRAMAPRPNARHQGTSTRRRIMPCGLA